MKTFWKFYTGFKMLCPLLGLIVANLILNLQEGSTVSATSVPKENTSDNFHAPTPKLQGTSSPIRASANVDETANSTPVPSTSPIEAKSNIAKRHIASLGQSVYEPYYSKYGKRYFSAPMTFRHRLANFRANSNEDRMSDLQKRFLGSLLDSDTIPAFEVESPEKKHVGSLISSRFSSYTKGQDKRHLAAFLQHRINPLNELTADKRHIGSLHSGSFSYISPNSGHENYKRFYGSVLKSFPSIPLDGNGTEIDAEDLFESELVADEDGAPSLPPLLKIFPPSHLIDTDKRHLSSLYNKRPASFFSELPQDDDTDIIKRHFSSLLDDSRIAPRYLASLLTSDRDTKRHISSLLDKRHLASLFNNDAPDKRHVASLLDDRDIGLQKRYFASLLDDRNPVDVKRFLASLLDRNDGSYGNPTGGELQQYDKRHFSSILDDRYPLKRYLGAFMRNRFDEESDYFPSQRAKRQLSTVSEEGEEGEEEKRHISSLLDKRYLASLLRDDSDSLNKRHLASIFDKRYLASLLDKRNLASLLDKKHVASLYDKKHVASLFDKKHVASLYDKKHVASLFDKKHVSSLYDKRHLSSLYDKRYLGSLFNKRYEELLDEPVEELTEESKRHLSSLLSEQSQNKRHLASLMANNKRDDTKIEEPNAEVSEIDQEKRHLSSLIKSRMTDAKRVPEETFTDENFIDGVQPYDKRHIGSLRGGVYGKRFFSTLLRDEINEDKRHLGSLMSKRGDSGTDSEQQKQEETATNPEQTHSRKKRYIGALAKNNNLPFRHSRGFGYTSHRSGRMNSGTMNSFFDYIESYIREALKKEEVRRRLQENNDFRLNANYQSGIGEEQEENPNKISIVEGPVYPQQEENGTPKIFGVPEEVAYFGTRNKRFLGSLARQMWFPRPYRSYAESSFSRGHFGSSPSARLHKPVEVLPEEDQEEVEYAPKSVQAYIPVVYKETNPSLTSFSGDSNGSPHRYAFVRY